MKKSKIINILIIVYVLCAMVIAYYELSPLVGQSEESKSQTKIKNEVNCAWCEVSGSKHHYILHAYSLGRTAHIITDSTTYFRVEPVIWVKGDTVFFSDGWVKVID